MVRVNWTIQAKEDLRSIYDYIAHDSKQYAKRQLLKIKKRSKVCIKHSRIGRVVPELERSEIRELVEGRYRIVYRIVSEK